MKKIFFIIVFIILRTTVFGQTNTLPTSGNVGIGTTTPSTLLQVKSGAFQQINIDNNSGIYLDATNTNQPKVGFRVSDNSERFRIHLQSVNTLTERLAFLRSLSGEAEVFSLLSSGKVGIGTPNPNALLDVGQTISNGQLGTVLARMVEGNANGDGTYLGVKAWGTQYSNFNGKAFSLEHSFYGYKNSAINFYRGDGMKGGYMTFETNDGTERMRIDNNGKVGIGTTNPSATLHLKSTTSIAIIEGTNPGIELHNSNGDNDFQMGLASGNGAYSRFAKYGDFVIAKVNTYGIFFIGNQLGGDIYFETGQSGWGSTSKVLAIYNNGKVGIGNTTAITGDYKLVVEGVIGAKKIRVTQLGWADYVFAPQYKLLPLQDLETYIKRYQHLPGVPTTEAVSKNGIDIGDMQTILLKKIEELTLYMIEQKKKTENLESENKSLNQKVKKLELKFFNK